MKTIKVSGSNVHNLNNVSVEIPRGKLTVITGPSGSGKSSLAFDTIYAEGQRRYIESLSSYARQFLGQIEPPDVETITGLSPSIAIDQKSTTKNPRSTVGTTTEIYDYMRILFSKTADAHSPITGKPLKAQSAQQMVGTVLDLPKKSKVQILSPVVNHKKGSHKEEIAQLMSMGFSRARIDNEFILLSDDISLNKNVYHTIEVVIDRILVKEGIESRVTDSIEHALKLGSGHIVININDEEDVVLSENYFDEETNISYPELSPRLFSFNSPLGACQECNGLGESKTFDENSLVTDENLSILSGSIGPLSKNNFLLQMVISVAKKNKVDLSLPFKELPDDFKKILFEGSDKIYSYSFESENSSFNFKKAFPGIINWLLKKYQESSSERVRSNIESFMKIEKCKSCEGKKLNPYALAAKIENKSIMDLCQIPLDEAYDFFQSLKFKGSKAIIAEKILKEINSRLSFLLNVGLNYLTLDRKAVTLSGGESQRIRLATQIGSALSGVIYVLDEPSIGLHQRDNEKLIKTLIALRDIGNTVIVVEHDEDTMLAADHLIDMGPGAGIHGGNIVAQGSTEDVIKNKNSLTGKYLSHEEKIKVPTRRKQSNGFISLKGASLHNLDKLDVDIPIGNLVCLTGVSGSGKSTLVHQILVPGMKKALKNKTSKNEKFKSLVGVDNFQSIIELDQAPIGRTPHSNPATYTGLFDQIRTVFSNTNESKIRGYKPGRFSFNVKGGRCDTCEGNGSLKIEMHFLPDVYIKCGECNGKRYNKETLSILYRGKNIADILDMSIEEALEFFQNHAKIHRALKVLNDVGLGYMKLGQPATTLSGGEAQRLKLSRELSKRPKGNCFYVLDEPTTGLHFQDVKVLLIALNKLVENGHTVLIIEHNLDVIKTADYILDLGPDGGKNGGRLVAKGSPEEVAKEKASSTGKYLSKSL